MKDTTKDIIKCSCGRNAKIEEFLGTGKFFYVVCPRSNKGTYICWFGPFRRSKADAVNAWNQVMYQVHKAKDKAK